MKNDNTKTKTTLDQVDKQMIRLLQKDGRMPIVSLSKELNISETTARTRLKRLINDKIINVVAVSNPIRLGFEIVGNLKLTIDLKKKDIVLEQLKKIDQLNYIALTTGETALDVEFIARSIEEFNALVFNEIPNIDGVISLDSSLIVEIIKDTWDYGTA